MNKSFRKLFHRYGLISENLSLLQKEIANILSELDYETWRNSNPDEESLKLFSIVCLSFTLPIGQKVEQTEEVSPVLALRMLLRQYQDLFGETSLNEEISNIVRIERNSKIESILRDNRMPERLSSKLKLSLNIICFWILFRIQLLTTLRILSLEDQELSARHNEQSILIDKFESALQSTKLQQDWQDIENLHNLAGHILSDIGNKECSYTEEDAIKYLDYLFSVNLPQWINSKNTLFSLINHVCIPLSFQKKILIRVRNSVFKLMLQNEYDIRRQYLPTLLNRRFYLPDKIDVRTVLPLNFQDGKRQTRAGMNLPLSHTEIVSLYFALKGKYIDTETDIYDFAYALTGYPSDQSKYFKKVVWIAEHKQTLGIFLGLLRPQGYERAKYWNLTPNFFLFKNAVAPFSPSDLSSPYGKFISHPETQNTSDWQELNEIIRATIKNNNKG